MHNPFVQSDFLRIGLFFVLRTSIKTQFFNLTNPAQRPKQYERDFIDEKNSKRFRKMFQFSKLNVMRILMHEWNWPRCSGGTCMSEKSKVTYESSLSRSIGSSSVFFFRVNPYARFERVKQAGHKKTIV